MEHIINLQLSYADDTMMGQCKHTVEEIQTNYDRAQIPDSNIVNFKMVQSPTWCTISFLPFKVIVFLSNDDKFTYSVYLRDLKSSIN